MTAGDECHGVLHIRVRLLQAVQGRRMACGLHQPAERHRTGRPDPRKIMRNHLGGINASAAYSVRNLDLTFGGSWSYYSCPHWGTLDWVDGLKKSDIRGAGTTTMSTNKTPTSSCAPTGQSPGVAPVRRHAIPLCALPGMGRQRQLQLGHLRDAAYRRR